MLNQLVLVGRLTSDVEVKKIGDKKVSTIVIAVPRAFKSANGDYETDYIPCTIWNGVAETTSEYCKKGDLLGIKGRVESKDNNIHIVAEKITFLSQKKEEKENE